MEPRALSRCHRLAWPQGPGLEEPGMVPIAGLLLFQPVWAGHSYSHFLL